MHNHQSKVVSESISNKIPTTRQVLKPNLRLRLSVFTRVHVDESEATTFTFRVDFKCVNLTKKEQHRINEGLDLLVDFVIVAAFFILFAEGGEAELFTFDSFYFAKAV